MKLRAHKALECSLNSSFHVHDDENFLRIKLYSWLECYLISLEWLRVCMLFSHFGKLSVLKFIQCWAIEKERERESGKKMEKHANATQHKLSKYVHF
jgi:hypothetical protein